MSNLVTLSSTATCSSLAINSDIRAVTLMIVRPSSYLDEYGFVRIFRKGYIPSNSSAVLWTLTRNFFERPEFDHIEKNIFTFDDAIWNEHKAMRILMQKLRATPDHKVIVFFAGVQTHELPRARDLARQSREVCGATPVIGGFGVSGVLRTLYWGIEDKRRPEFPKPDREAFPHEIQDLIKNGIVVFDGEAEGTKFGEMLCDILNGTPQPLYYEQASPDITFAPLPDFPPGYMDNLVGSVNSTVDPTRGCPFICTFCSIINFRGRDVRFRDPDSVVRYLIARAVEHGHVHAFFNDDNFARSKMSVVLLEKLAEAREQGYQITFTTELDAAALKGKPWYVDLLKKAGCEKVFVGIESMNPENLADAEKWQNNVADYRVFAEALHEAGISTHAGYIIGFRYDTPKSVVGDVELLSAIFDMASFFCLTPIPGSQDHAAAVRDGMAMDADPNAYNSFQPVCGHPRMSRQEWLAAYQQSWEIFYRPEFMIEKINRKRTVREKFALLGNFMLWRLAFACYRVHPMVAGLGQQWDYHDRRPEALPLPYPAWMPAYLAYAVDHMHKRIRVGRALIREFAIFRRVILESNLPSLAIGEKKVTYIEDLGNILSWAKNTFSPSRLNHVYLRTFWTNYRKQGWKLLTNPLNITRHLAAIPLIVTEVADRIKFMSFILPRVLREVKKA